MTHFSLFWSNHVADESLCLLQYRQGGINDPDYWLLYSFTKNSIDMN